MRLFGRKIILTTLDEIPRRFRASPGYLALNQSEINALKSNDGNTFKRILDIVQSEDMRDALLKYEKPKVRKTTLQPSSRMARLNVLVGR